MGTNPRSEASGLTDWRPDHVPKARLVIKVIRHVRFGVDCFGFGLLVGPHRGRQPPRPRMGRSGTSSPRGMRHHTARRLHASIGSRELVASTSDVR